MSIAARLRKVSVLFSEPKIPQFQRTSRMRVDASHVSVLFSEPKIPQFRGGIRMRHKFHSFSALQRAENSSMGFRCEKC